MAQRPPLKFADFWITFLRLVSFAIIITGLAFGARQTYFSVGVSRVVGTEIDADLKLALLGFFNKSLDVILVSSLEYTASMMLTVWMARSKIGKTPTGADFNDFGLKDELTKPWMTLASFFTRWRRSKWSWRSLFRCLLCLSISISVMLQGLAINTIAVPKARWYPNNLHTWKMTEGVRKSMTIVHPKTYLQAVDWYNLLGVGQSNVGNESYPPWDWALGLSASLSFAGLTHIVSTIRRSEKSWQNVYLWQLDGDSRKRWTAVNTVFSTPGQPIETISTDDEQVMEVFNWLRKMNHRPSVSSTGWTGNLTLVVPTLNTICASTNQSNQTSPFAVTVPSENSTRDATFSIRLGSIPSMNFTGAICSSTFRQALFPVNFWIVNMAGVDVSFNDYGHDWNKTIVYEPTVASDHHIAQALAIQTRDSLPRMEALVQTSGLINYFLLMSRMLQKADSAIFSDAAGLSVIIGVLLQNILSTSNKYRSTLPDTIGLELHESITSFPIQWQLYGSGPRLAWEWLTVIVLMIVLASLCFAMYQTLRNWIGPGSWVELGGMMMLAQTSPPLKNMDDTENAQKRVYWVEESDKGSLLIQSKSQ
jgi:hypothetical protein